MSAQLIAQLVQAMEQTTTLVALCPSTARNVSHDLRRCSTITSGHNVVPAEDQGAECAIRDSNGTNSDLRDPGSSATRHRGAADNCIREHRCNAYNTTS